MKLIGLIGGMSWESSALYYSELNRRVQARLGGLHSARTLLYSVDFHDIEAMQRAGEWVAAGQLLSRTAQALESAGADFIVLCTNTMHKVAPAIEAAVRIPLLHIVDPTAAELKRAGYRHVALLGTRFTMEQEFYRDRLRDAHGIEALVPDAVERAIVHRIIYEELCVGRVLESSRAQYRRIIEALVGHGAQAVILGCTEITMLIGPQDATVPVVDTTALHARAAVELALADPD
ncbi:MAG TPA: aspartate/glutamate racemase family protein [Burkholderiaceae bacterium]|nr:aspartate/glutamate racemase family protein [Burkholderiaceae bacterium]